VICAACPHPRGLHSELSGCRVNGCPCEQFVKQGAKPEAAAGPQRVAIDVPPGYTLHVVLVPPGGVIEGVEMPEEADGA